MTELLVISKAKATILVIGYVILMAPLCSFGRDASGADVSDDTLLEEISHAAFLFFIREADPESGLVWKLFMSNEHIRAGIRRAGFQRNLDSKSD